MKITGFLQKNQQICWAGELSIEKAFEQEFPTEDIASAKQDIHLCCFAHVETNMENNLSKKTPLDGKRRHKVITDIFGKEFNI